MPEIGSRASGPKVKDVVALSEARLLVFFDNGKTRIFDIKKLFQEYPEYKVLLDIEENKKVKVEPGGYGVSWNSELDCSEGELYNDGQPVAITLQDLYAFVRQNLVTANQAAEILNCSKQNVSDLVKRNQIRGVSLSTRTTLYSKTEVESRRW